MSFFSFKGIEYGHYVDDSKGLEHLIHSTEAFMDLADMLNMNYFDMSLNVRLSVCFGSRGRGNALGHYEADTKAINFTKHKGCLGILAHEYFHAIDNYLFDFSHSYKNGQMGYVTDIKNIGLSLSLEVVEAIQDLRSSILSGNGYESVNIEPSKQVRSASRYTCVLLINMLRET
ncbi:hypothetical protein DX928_23310 [Bacillus swezeyi]|uniref:Large polyvalent protein-associated domain-containing protein n=1 Tax=Bacillus swezeyi TaxID=1925020 RepID=A0A5M8RJ95_9BACI|nr:hypothetical protein DX927_23070 [Bacillus swezeyi]KAA6471504.1 hypothetical protein DX928_23310 [Bacillus swezeyi]